MARKMRMTAGRIVQIVSICCASRVFREEYFEERSENSAYPTTEIMRTRITIAWSWNWVSIFMIGDAAS